MHAPSPPLSPATPHAATDAALALLRTLCGRHGIHASASATANYRAVFARDAVMAGIAGVLAGDAVVADGLARTLDGLRATQGAEGQIASNYEPRDGAEPKVSFGTLAPRLDSALWYLVGIAVAARAGAMDAAPFRDSAARVVRLLDAIEYNGRHLLWVPMGGDWADEWPYSGYVLHDQVLRAWALRLLARTFDEPAWGAKGDAIAATIAERFAPLDAARPHPPSAVGPAGARDEFDLAACALLAVSGTAPSLADPALDWIAERWLSRGALPPAFAPVIDEGHPDWATLRGYHLHGFRNRPHEYHNGGIWPIWLGWLALALGRAARADDLARLRAAVDSALAPHPGFAFDEYLHGRTLQPLGTSHMAYTATGLVFLRLADRAERLAALGA